MDDKEKLHGSDLEDQRYSITPTPTHKVSILQPWHPNRHTIRVDEVPAFLRHLYGLSTSYPTVCKWAREGVTGKDGKQIYLKTKKVMGGRRRCRMVKKVDLLAFLEAW